MWQPTITKNNLIKRAEILACIRQFFAVRNVLEVETPLLSHATVTDPHLNSFIVEAPYRARKETPCRASLQDYLYLQTSPEFAMKRLLANGSGAIYQICKAFRAEESGSKHNPEFTMLEWYRPDFDHHALMDEVDELLQFILQTKSAERFTYQGIFEKYLQINPHILSAMQLQRVAIEQGINNIRGIDHTDKDTWLNLLMTHVIEQHLGQNNMPTFIYDYPASQAALAKVNVGNRHACSESKYSVAERFEVYINGIELANGFHELTDADEQAKRFQQDLIKREQLGLPKVVHDERLLAALKHGLPACAGVALGVDRLIMLALQTNNINDVISFSFHNS